MSSEKIDYCLKLVSRYGLDLHGLWITTEYCGTGNYAYTKYLLAYAGADGIFYISKDTEKSYRKLVLSKSDIVLNLGGVRPLGISDVLCMKPGSVVAAMMAKDQVRKDDICIPACMANDIKIACVDEERIGILESMGYKMLKALFEAGLSVWRDKYLLYAPGNLGLRYRTMLDKVGADFTEIVRDCNVVSFADYDAIIVADYTFEKMAVGSGAVFDIARIVKHNPDIKIIWISGNVDVEAVADADIFLFPNKACKAHYTALTGDYLSYKVTLELNAAGLKAAQDAIRRK